MGTEKVCVSAGPIILDQEDTQFPIEHHSWGFNSFWLPSFLLNCVLEGIPTQRNNKIGPTLQVVPSFACSLGRLRMGTTKQMNERTDERTNGIAFIELCPSSAGRNKKKTEYCIIRQGWGGGGVPLVFLRYN